MTTIASRLQAVKARISEAARAAGRSPGEIALIAVSKTFPPRAIAEAWAAGQRAFGENYVQEGVEKIRTLGSLSLEQRAASPDAGNLDSPGDMRPSDGVRQRDADGALRQAVELARGSTSSIAGIEAPRSGAPSPRGPLLLPLEWQVASPDDKNPGSPGDMRPSGGVASPRGPLLLPLEWHYIGPIQSNKARLVAENFDWAHCVDRAKIAERLSASRRDNMPPLQVCIQVNISGETTKSGIAPDAVLALAQAIMRLPGLCLRGLMAIPEPTTDTPLQRSRFRRMRELRDELLRMGVALDTLSMGMSDDLEAAIAEGATMVRVGRAIFGERGAGTG